MTHLQSAQEELAARNLFGGALVMGMPGRFVDVSDFRPVPDNQEVLYFRRYQSLNSSAACHLRRCSPLALQVFTDASVDQSFITEVLVRSVCAAARSTNPLARG